ncbi:MAG TPA: hypothetical protein VF690_16745 [Hymenobacter sp.]
MPIFKDSLPAQGFYEQLNRGFGPELLLRRERRTVAYITIPAVPASKQVPTGRPQ